MGLFLSVCVLVHRVHRTKIPRLYRFLELRFLSNSNRWLASLHFQRCLNIFLLRIRSLGLESATANGMQTERNTLGYAHYQLYYGLTNFFCFIRLVVQGILRHQDRVSGILSLLSLPVNEGSSPLDHVER